MPLHEEDRKALWYLLDQHNGNQSAVARLVGCSVATIRKRMLEIGYAPNPGGRPRVSFVRAARDLTQNQENSPEPPSGLQNRLLDKPGRRAALTEESVVYPVSSAFHGLIPGEFPSEATAVVEIPESAAKQAYERMTREDLLDHVRRQLSQKAKAMPEGWPVRVRLKIARDGSVVVSVTQWKRRDGSGVVDC